MPEHVAAGRPRPRCDTALSEEGSQGEGEVGEREALNPSRGDVPVVQARVVEAEELGRGKQQQGQAAVWAAALVEEGGSWHEWVGQSRILRVRLGPFTAYIGPHWYFTLTMLAIIIFSGIFFIQSSSDNFNKAMGCFMALASSIALLQCAAADSGCLVAPPPGGVELGVALPCPEKTTAKMQMCKPCGLARPAKARHCNFCGVCVAGWDHHCPWMGKCIGEGNLNAFHRLLWIGGGSLVYIVLTVVLAPN